ncbi:MAG: bifunctional biotin--[acetyl-CoA-carboxylase] ligase/biotin operon repressor BirA [Gammaproteobacteria bacterium]|nr:bifunctional biotin--[acetyl-CoA-carboxylase] ligase/biotin operon repressor BirA [Gammaproteobacteria bacterium]
MITQQSLLTLLSDGKYHSGSALGQQLGVSRAAIWKMIQKIETELGISVYAVKGKGYRLQQPLELLNKELIIGKLNNKTAVALSQFDLLFDIDSTNRYLTGKGIDGALTPYLAIAEQQTKGQGRRGKAWVSPFGANLYLSLLWRFQFGPAQLGCLGLAVAVAIVRAINKLGVKDVGVKWPNDIYWKNKKIAGILLEMRGESSGPSSVVIGVGVNVAMPDSNKKIIEQIDQPWVDIASIIKKKVERNHFAAIVVNELFRVLNVFPEKQNEILEEWKKLDVLKGQQVDIHYPDKVISGVALGINNDGALRLRHNGKEMLCYSGEVSVRRGQ